MTIKINNGEFIFFCCNEGNVDLLKYEIKNKYPGLKLSYSFGRFLTYKTNEDLLLSEIDLVFTTRWAKSIRRFCKKELLAQENHLMTQTNNLFHCYSLLESGKMDDELILSISKNQADISQTEEIYNLVKVKEDEYWLGVHSSEQRFAFFPNSNPDISLPKEAPSRAYLKLAEAVTLFDISLFENQKWLELGSAPGGASYYLLQRGAQVWGNDPAEMSTLCLSNKKFTHIKKPVQHITVEEIPADIEWISVDLNLNPKQSLLEVFRICKDLRFLKGIFVTVKIINVDHVGYIQDNIDWAYGKGFDRIMTVQLPSHKREYLLMLQNKNTPKRLITKKV